MGVFSATSQAKLATCDVELRLLFNEVVKKVDCTILVGHRNEVDQEKAFAEGHSDKHWPSGNHNKLPSIAVDVAPVVPIGTDVWNVKDPAVQVKWWALVYCVLSIANEKGIAVRWGMDWNGDGDITDTRLKDWPHWELVT